jgi:hypothetical protein
MDNLLKKTVSEMAEEYTGTEPKKAFKDGAAAAFDAVRGYLSVSSHLSDIVKISDLRKFISRISL